MDDTTDIEHDQPSLAVPPLNDTRRQRIEVKYGAAMLAAGVITLVLLRLFTG